MTNLKQQSLDIIANRLTQAPHMIGKSGSYLELKNFLAEMVQSGDLPPGTRLPSERMLQDLLGYARGTIRDALTVMESEGTIHRLDRRGWFVSPPRVRYDPTTLEGFHTFVEAQGRTPRTETVSKQLAPVGMEAASIFGLEPNDQVYLILRRRYIDDRPVLFEHIYVDPQRFNGLIDHNLDGSLSAVLEGVYGMSTARARVTMFASVLTGKMAQELQVAQGTPSLYMTRACYSKDGAVTEYNRNYWHYNALKLVFGTS